MTAAHVTDRWLVPPAGPASITDRDPASLSGAPGDRVATETETAEQVRTLASLQDRLYAQGTRALLVVLQGMDASGKDGTVKHVFTGVNPQGVNVTSFKEPTTLEAAHDFLWRVHAQVPPAGHIGIFNRSHYEDVLVARVRRLVPEKVWRSRYDDIVAFERMLSRSGTAVVKIMLHVSYEEQGRRLEERTERPDKQWKVGASDLGDRALWSDYQAAYEEAVSRTSTKEAPWYVVPADRKWFRNWAIGQILVRRLEQLDPHYPPGPGS